MARVRVRGHVRRQRPVRPHFRNAMPADQAHFDLMRHVNEGKEGEQLRKLMQNVQEEMGSPLASASAEITTTSDGFTNLTIMDPRTGYMRSFHIGCRGPAEQIALLIAQGQRVELPDGYVVEAR